MIGNKYFEFRVQNKMYLYDIECGNIITADKISKKDESPISGNQEKESNIREHVPISEEEWKSGRVLNKMALSISHACNMRCAYCFADGGTYGSKKIMSKATAKDAIDYFFKYASKEAPKYNMHFMGGEPLLNLDVFYFSIDYMNNKVKECGIPVRYTLTTNGTIINEKIMDYIIKNNIHLNFSIDGGQKIHDLNRRFTNGEGSFNKVLDTLDFIKKHGYYNMTARMTLTKPGLESFADDINFLWDLGFYYVFFDLVKTNLKELAVDESNISKLKEELSKLVKSDKYLERLREGRNIRNLSDKEYFIDKNIIRRECTYYNTNLLQFTPEGDLYKCPYTVGDAKHQCGNIYSGLEWENYTGTFKIREVCKSCWARKLCGGGCGIDWDCVRCEYNKIIAEFALKNYVLKKCYLEV